jgi:hypothetical protein
MARQFDADNFCLLPWSSDRGRKYLKYLRFNHGAFNMFTRTGYTSWVC